MKLRCGVQLKIKKEGDVIFVNLSDLGLSLHVPGTGYVKEASLAIHKKNLRRIAGLVKKYQKVYEKKS